MTTGLTPRLIVAEPDEARRFYADALDGETVERFVQDGIVVHAKLHIRATVGPSVITLAAEVAEWGLLSPTTLGGSPTLLTLHVPDARSTAERMVEHGAEIVIPIEDRFYGRCEGRVRDPFGHLWIPSHELGTDT
jgi:uncharacterized glyoxalase superfamily protein PhnB